MHTTLLSSTARRGLTCSRAEVQLQALVRLVLLLVQEVEGEEGGESGSPDDTAEHGEDVQRENGGNDGESSIGERAQPSQVEVRRLSQSVRQAMRCHATHSFDQSMALARVSVLCTRHSRILSAIKQSHVQPVLRYLYIL